MLQSDTLYNSTQVGEVQVSDLCGHCWRWDREPHTSSVSFFIEKAVKRCVMQEVDIFPVETELVF